MKKLLTLSLLLVSCYCYSQETLLEKKDGISISYQLQKLKEDAKKDYYLITVYLKNDNGYDLFYQGPKNGVNPFLGGVSIRSADEYVYLEGSKSRLSTELGALYYIKKGDSLKFTKEFKVNKTPNLVVTSYFIKDSELKQISEFR